jgi:hypothetical protein
MTQALYAHINNKIFLKRDVDGAESSNTSTGFIVQAGAL